MTTTTAKGPPSELTTLPGLVFPKGIIQKDSNDFIHLTGKSRVDLDVCIDQGKVIATSDSSAEHKLNPVIHQGMNSQPRQCIFEWKLSSLYDLSILKRNQDHDPGTVEPR